MAQRRRATEGSSPSQSAAAAALLEKIRALRSDLPGFTQPQKTTASRRLASNAGLPDDFLESVTVAVQSSPALAAASGINPDEVRETIRFSAAYGPVAEELDAMARAVRHTINVRRANTAQDSLAAYEVAKGLARKTDGA